MQTSSKVTEKRSAQERIQRVIELCKSIEEKGLDPFIVNVEDLIAVVHALFKDWSKTDELILDAEAVNSLASVIKLQSDWLKKKSTSLYTDPFLLQEKIQALSKDAMVDVFLKSWRPIISFEQITEKSLALAMGYWKDLLPVDERWQLLRPDEVRTGTITDDELIRQRILVEQSFNDRLNQLWEDLKSKSIGGGGKVSYKEFVYVPDFLETVNRAYLTSFLVTYGYARLEVHVLEEEVFIIPNEKPIVTNSKERAISFPISVTYEEWLKWKEQHQNLLGKPTTPEK